MVPMQLHNKNSFLFNSMPKDISKIVLFCRLLIATDMEAGLSPSLHSDLPYNCNYAFFSIKYHFVKKHAKYFG